MNRGEVWLLNLDRNHRLGDKEDSPCSYHKQRCIGDTAIAGDRSKSPNGKTAIAIQHGLCR